jgi:hypothetical protein
MSGFPNLSAAFHFIYNISKCHQCLYCTREKYLTSLYYQNLYKNKWFHIKIVRNIAFSQTRMPCCTDCVHYSGRADGLCYPKHSGNTWYQTTRLWGAARKGSKNMLLSEIHDMLVNLGRFPLNLPINNPFVFFIIYLRAGCLQIT